MIISKNSKIVTNEISSLQETKMLNKSGRWTRMEGWFQWSYLPSYGKSKSCGVLTSYIGTLNFAVNNQKTDHDGRILILDITVKDLDYTFINLLMLKQKQMAV